MKSTKQHSLLLIGMENVLVKNAPTIFEQALKSRSISTDKISQLIHPKYRSGKKLMDTVSLLTTIFTNQGIFVTYAPAINIDSLFKNVSKEIQTSSMPKIVTENSWQKEAMRLIAFYKDITKLFLSKKDRQAFFYYYGLNKHFRRYTQKEICSICKIDNSTRFMEIINGVWKSMSKKYKKISPSNISTILKEICVFATQNRKYINWETYELKPLL